MSSSSLFDDEPLPATLGARPRSRPSVDAGMSEAEVRARVRGDAGQPQPLPSLRQEEPEPSPARSRAANWPDLSGEAERLFGALKPPLEEGRGLAVQFMAATSGEGTSTMAREFAVVAARSTDKPVLLLDLDWTQGHQFDAVQTCHPELGRPGPPHDLGFPMSTALLGPASNRLVSDGTGVERAALTLTLHRIGRSSLLVSRLSNPSGTPVHYVHNSRWWNDLRSRVALTVVDAPSFERSVAGIAVCSAMDGVVLVVQAEKARLPVIETLRAQLLGQSAYIAGIVFNRRRYYIPESVYGLL